MFCPNCGKNCGSENFCIVCGTRILQAPEQPVCKPEWKVGMPCPYCAATKLEGSCCAYCGAQLLWDPAPQKQLIRENPKKMKSTKNSTDIPTTMGFSGQNGVIAFFDSAVSISTGGLKNKKRTLIPFDQLVIAVYLRPTTWKSGALLLRGEGNKHVPVPERRHMHLDDAAVTFSTDPDDLFYHIFQMLKAVAPPAAKFEMIIPEIKIRNLDQTARNIDLNYYWNAFAPFRDRAIEQITGQYGINKKAAKALVDREFDARQKIRYEADPKDAIRDLNKLVDKMKNASRLRGEIREIQRQDRIERSLQHIESMIREK